MFNIGNKVKIARIDDLVQQGSFEVVDSYLGKTGTITDSQESTYGVMYEITFDEEVDYDGLFFSETEVELVDENEDTLEVGNLTFHNYVDKEGNIIADYTKESGYLQFDGSKLFNIDKDLFKREYLCTWVGNEDDLAIKLNDEESVNNE